METLTKEQARQLATQFTDFASGIANYRHDSWESLTVEQRDQLDDLESDLMISAGEMNALAGVLALEAVQDSVDVLNTAISDAKEFLKKVAEIKTGIDVITTVLALASAVSAKDPQEIAKELQALKKLVA